MTLCIYDGLYKTDCALYNVKCMKQFYCKNVNMEWKDILFPVEEWFKKFLSVMES